MHKRFAPPFVLPQPQTDASLDRQTVILGSRAQAHTMLRSIVRFVSALGDEL